MDKREEFERLTREQPGARDERAFIRRRMDLVRNDPRLTPEERERALSELRRQLGDDADAESE